MGTWTHTVLEVYDLEGIGFGVSREEMAERIDEGEYAWCVVEDDIVVYFMPLWKILWIKLKKYVDNLYSIVYNNVYYPLYIRTPWGKRYRQKMDAFWDSMPVMTEQEFDELQEDWEAIAENKERYE